jgi:hypothetical protein
MAEAERSGIGSSIREKFGTDYLGVSSSGVSSGGEDPVSVDRAVAAFGSVILSTLQRSRDRSGRIYDLVDETGLKLETLLGVTGKLASLGLIEVAQSDKYGNHRIRITQLGEDSLKI